VLQACMRLWGAVVPRRQRQHHNMLVVLVSELYCIV
jgi:hypothetical protein